MIVLLRGLARLVGFVLAVLLAVGGLAAVVFSVQGGESTLSLPKLAELTRLSDLRGSVGTLLLGLEASGAVAQASALAGVGGVVVGLALLIGTLVGRSERLVLIARGDGGRLAVRRRALAQIAVALVEQSRESVRAKVSVRARRRGTGGRMRVTSFHPDRVSEQAASEAASRQLAPLAEALSLRVRTRGSQPRRGRSRVA